MGVFWFVFKLAVSGGLVASVVAAVVEVLDSRSDAAAAFNMLVLAGMGIMVAAILGWLW